MIGRREFLTAFCGAVFGSAIGWPAYAETKVPRLCFPTFDPGSAQSPTARFKTFFERLAEIGYAHPQTLTMDYIAAEGRTDQYPALAAECVAHNPDVIAVTTTPGAHALKRATQTIPIVMVALGDPIGTGLVESLAKPGGNLTGMSQMTSALAAKRLQLLKEAMPGISRVLILTYLVDQISPLQAQAMKEAAPALDLTPLFHDISTANDLPAAFEQGSKKARRQSRQRQRAYFAPTVRK